MWIEYIEMSPLKHEIKFQTRPLRFLIGTFQAASGVACGVCEHSNIRGQGELSRKKFLCVIIVCRINKYRLRSHSITQNKHGADSVVLLANLLLTQ